MQYTDFRKNITIRNFVVSSTALIEVADATNEYINNLVKIFNDIGFDLFYSLGQRNISGFIGEIFKNILASKYPQLTANPHPDGRPDVLVLETPSIKNYYDSCFYETNGRLMPTKDLFTPFKYGGIEVKCSIGTSGKSQTKKYIAEKGHGFALYNSRAGYLSGITWWAHHSSSSNLLGIYYDYYENDNGIPQIIAAFFSELDESDWHKVSKGDPTHKKTSNTSLNKSGISKMKANCLFCCSDTLYTNQLRKIKCNI